MARDDPNAKTVSSSLGSGGASPYRLERAPTKRSDRATDFGELSRAVHLGFVVAEQTETVRLREPWRGAIAQIADMSIPRETRDQKRETQRQPNFRSIYPPT